MNTLSINNQDITIKEYMGKRVVTFKEIDQVHNRSNGTASRNFRENRQYFVEGVDYFIVQVGSDEIRRNLGISKYAGGKNYTLLTETGYLMLVKSFTDELAWQVQRELVNNYFRVPVQSTRVDDATKMQKQLTTLNELVAIYKIKKEEKLLQALKESISAVAIDFLVVATCLDPTH